jgi:hypothetical protein
MPGSVSASVPLAMTKSPCQNPERTVNGYTVVWNEVGATKILSIPSLNKMYGNWEISSGGKWPFLLFSIFVPTHPHKMHVDLEETDEIPGNSWAKKFVHSQYISRNGKEWLRQLQSKRLHPCT